jgi:hypothetical protein
MTVVPPNQKAAELDGIGSGMVRTGLSADRLRRKAGLALAALTLALVSGCSKGDSGAPTQPSPPTPPTPATASVAGTWVGPATDSSGGGPMSWQLTQANTSFSGTVTMTDTATGIEGRGSVSGTVSASSLHFSISIPAGGFDHPFESCSAAVSGDGEVSSASLMGTYTGSSSCGGSIASGTLSLSKQP